MRPSKLKFINNIINKKNNARGLSLARQEENSYLFIHNYPSNSKKYDKYYFTLIFSFLGLICLMMYLDQYVYKDKPFLGISENIWMIVVPIITIVLPIIIITIKRKLKLKEELLEFTEFTNSTYEVITDTTENKEVKTDTTENKEVYAEFAHNELYANLRFHEKYKNMNIKLRLVKINKNKKIYILTYTTIAILFLYSFFLQIYILIPVTPILYILIKEYIILLKSKIDISKYNKDISSQTKLHPYVIFEIATRLNFYEIISKAWKHKIFKLVISTLYITFFTLILFFISLLVKEIITKEQSDSTSVHSLTTEEKNAFYKNASTEILWNSLYTILQDGFSELAYSGVRNVLTVEDLKNGMDALAMVGPHYTGIEWSYEEDSTPAVVTVYLYDKAFEISASTPAVVTVDLYDKAFEISAEYGIGKTVACVPIENTFKMKWDSIGEISKNTEKLIKIYKENSLPTTCSKDISGKVKTVLISNKSK